MDYGKIIKRSWELTWRNKWLWVYGLVIAVMSDGVGFQGMRGIDEPTNWWRGSKENKEDILPKELPEKIVEVLGRATNAVTEWFKSIPVGVWVIGGIGLIGVIVIMIAIRWVMLSWAKGGLIYGLWAADSTEEKVNLENTSARGIKSIKRLIWLSAISFFVTLGIVLGFVLLSGLGLLGFNFLFSPAKEILMAVWGIAMFLTFVVVMFLLGMVAIWAERLIVLENYSAMEAWKAGFSLSWKHFWSVILMGIINGAIGCAAGCLSMVVMLIMLGIPAAIIATPLFKNEWDGICWWSMGTLGVLFLLFIYLNLLVRIILTVFSYGNWNQYFKFKMQSEKLKITK